MKDLSKENNKKELLSDENLDLKSANVSLSYFLYRLIAFADARRSIATFVIIFSTVVISDIIFNSYFYSHDIAGLISCYYNGLPFFRNTLVSTIGFSIYFYSCYKFVFNYDNLYQSVKR